MKLFLFLPFKIMKTKNLRTIVLALSAILLASCCHKEPVNQLVGHWGCETYISCRTHDDGSEQWDTLHYDVGSGQGYELWFREDGSGKLKLNESPAFIKEFSCTYELDEENKQVLIYGNGWLYALYGSQYLDQNEMRFDLEECSENAFTASWINYVSEDKPFFERFYLKRIE